jgi:hypothetical protein
VPHQFACPYLGLPVELTDEREAHIRGKHDEIFATGLDLLSSVLANPDLVQRDTRFPDTLVFSRWYDELIQDKHVIVVVVVDEAIGRNWIVTAFLTRRLPGRDILWSQR